MKSLALPREVSTHSTDFTAYLQTISNVRNHATHLHYLVFASFAGLVRNKYYDFWRNGKLNYFDDKVYSSVSTSTRRKKLHCHIFSFEAFVRS